MTKKYIVIFLFFIMLIIFPQHNIAASSSAYQGKVEHIFFHPLISYNERAFDGDKKAKGMDDWFVTVKEFKAILEQLYSKQYILVNMEKLYEEKDVDGIKTLHKKELLLPQGKKPLILSIDDLNYNQYMLENGTSSKLIVDKKGKLATRSTNLEGKEVISYDNEIVTILESFIEKHPDFSFNNARGIIALTGYEGVLGYRTNKDSPTKDKERIAVIPVVNALKEKGWTFANHSYSHPNVSEIPFTRLKRDTELWKTYVEPIIGQTPVYIYPFGDGVKSTDQKFSYLQQQGYSIFCGVGPTSQEEVLSTKHAIIMDRRHVDGFTLRTQRKNFLDLYDADTVLDLHGRSQK